MGLRRETSQGNKHILVCTDNFTKWCKAFPTRDQKAGTVAEILVSKIFSHFGPPTVLHSDERQNLESDAMHSLCDIMGILKLHTMSYHPSCHGLVERQNRTLQNMLGISVSKHQTDWDLWLDPIVYAYNTSKHEPRKKQCLVANQSSPLR